MIRYAQVGMRDKLLSSKELWSCYACGECSDSCPTQAEPSEFMAAARRYAIASYDRTGFARLMYTMPLLGTLIAVALAAFFALFMYAAHGPMSGSTLDIFNFIPEDLIHNTGIVVMIVIFAAGLLGLATMARRVSRDNSLTLRSLFGGRAALTRAAGAAWDAIAVDTLAQRRYRADCESPEKAVRWYRARWFLHAAAMWGFLGLLAATILDYGLALLGSRRRAPRCRSGTQSVSLGHVAGIALVYGATMLIGAAPRPIALAPPFDGGRLDPDALIRLTGVTGFGLELALYLPSAPVWGYWVFLFHVAIAMELVILAPFMKLAHAIYRPVALFFLALCGAPSASRQGGRPWLTTPAISKSRPVELNATATPSW